MFEHSPVCVDGVIARAVEAAGDRFQDTDCHLTVTVSDNLPAVSGDEDTLVIALLNLLDNAWKYSAVPREISIRAGCQENQVCIAVSDNGIGLSRAESRRVFQKFYQVDQSLAREGYGCGLGLSIVSEIARAHGGEINVASSQGKGSTFTLRIPVATRAEGG